MIRTRLAFSVTQSVRNICLASVVLGSNIARADNVERVPIGAIASELLFKDRTFLTRSLSELNYRSIVVFVMDSSCPLVEKLVPLVNAVQDLLARYT